MSRYLRKAHGTDEIFMEKSVDSSDNEPTIPERKLFNTFDLLNVNSDALESEEIEPPDQETEEAPAGGSEVGKRKKKKKRRKRAESAKTSENVKEEEEEEEEEQGDEIERTVREVNKLLGEPAACSSTAESVPSHGPRDSILKIQYNFFNPENEFKSIYGSNRTQTDQIRNRNRGRTRYPKKMHLVVPMQEWYLIGRSGLSMHIDTTIKTTDGFQYFNFSQSPSYQKIQEKFVIAVESNNPENLINIMNVHPYHIDTLLQLSDVCKLNENLQMAAELIARALFCLECALHPSFNIAAGNCRLSYKVPTNRAFYITLFKHMLFVGGRACYRTSLEFCKLIMTLDPEGDPLAIVLAIDFYALRAREYQWFVNCCNLWEESRNLTQLPNIAFSLALAHFHLNSLETADELLEKALFMFPGVLLPLLHKCGVSPDTRVMGHDYFNRKVKSSTPDALEKIQDLYVARSYHLWQEPSVMAWLESATHRVLDRDDAGDEYSEFCRNKRLKRYQGHPPRNILRHIFLSDFKDVSLGPNFIRNNERIFAYDPLPPMSAAELAALQNAPRASRVPANSNLLSLFISSFYSDLEWRNITVNGLHRRDDGNPRDRGNGEFD